MCLETPAQPRTQGIVERRLVRRSKHRAQQLVRVLVHDGMRKLSDARVQLVRRHLLTVATQPRVELFDLAHQPTSKLVESAAPGEPQAAMLPLVRLRVDHSGGFPTVPLQRFGAPFQGRVANPWDLLQFHKAAQRRTGAGKKEHAATGESLAPEGAAEAGEYLAPELGDFRRIDALVAEHLPATLQILTEGDMAAALEEFVQHDEKGALEKAVKSALLESQRRVAAKGALGGEDAKELNQAINTSVKEMKEASLAKRAANKEKKEASKASKEGAREAADEAEEEPEPEPEDGAAAQPKAKAPKAAAAMQPIQDDDAIRNKNKKLYKFWLDLANSKHGVFIYKDNSNKIIKKNLREEQVKAETDGNVVAILDSGPSFGAYVALSRKAGDKSVEEVIKNYKKYFNEGASGKRLFC